MISRNPPRRLRIAPLALAASLLLSFAAGTAAAKPFGFEDVVAKAQKASMASFDDTGKKVPQWLIDIGYDKWRDIRFRPDKSLWGETGTGGFALQFFHPGLYYDRVVAINVVDAQGVRPFAFRPALFDYGKNDFASRVPQDLGFAGFRVHYPMNKPEYRDEVIVFLGASYFRALGKDQVFGISARGLAIDTALPSGEEFPFFKEFWILRPAPNASEIQIYALLDSPRMTGAYAFVVRPGTDTVVSVDSRLFLRSEVGKVGIAPLTSMFFHGENSTRKFIDFRPEVHDSDGLLVNFANGEWLWRPLDNPETLRVSSFQLPNPKGFGILQRDRDFDHYQDLEARTDDRPSTWIEPKAAWGAGRLELVEIPTNNEVNDNIVSYWVPERVAKPTEPMTFAYDVHWYRDAKNRPPGGRVVATRRDRGSMEGVHRFIVDFEGEKLKKLRGDTIVRGVITVGARTEIGEELVEQHVVKNERTGGWRLGFQVRPKDEKPIELRAFLQRGEDVLTETWTYTLNP